MAINKSKAKRPKSAANGGGNLQDSAQRSVLPIPDIPPNSLTTFDAKDPDTKYPPIRPISPPDGAPNVMVILIDDAGYGSSSPSADRARPPILKSSRKADYDTHGFTQQRYVRRHAPHC
jgi:hypothetical protein